MRLGGCQTTTTCQLRQSHILVYNKTFLSQPHTAAHPPVMLRRQWLWRRMVQWQCMPQTITVFGGRMYLRSIDAMDVTSASTRFGLAVTAACCFWLLQSKRLCTLTRLYGCWDEHPMCTYTHIHSFIHPRSDWGKYAHRACLRARSLFRSLNAMSLLSSEVQPSIGLCARYLSCCLIVPLTC